MRTSAAGSSGFTLLELMVVVSIIAMASAGVGFALRDSAHTLLERDAQRLAALCEAARAQSRTSGVAVRWRATARGFHFDGAAAGSLPEAWLGSDTVVAAQSTLQLGPEPIIGPQQVVLRAASQPQLALRVATDGVRPFSVQPLTTAP